jgi:hypothetical protein
MALLILSLAFGVMGCGKSSKDGAKSLQITDKKMEADTFGHPSVSGKIKNTGGSTFNSVLVKVTFSDEAGKIIDQNYGMFGPVEAGKDFSFTLKGTGDYYAVKDYNVWVDSAE